LGELASFAGGVTFEHQYGLKLRLSFEAEFDSDAHVFAQVLLSSFDDAVAGPRAPQNVDFREAVLSYGFLDLADYMVTDPDGTVRAMSLIPDADCRRPDLVGQSTYAIALSVDFEADTDGRARELADSITEMFGAGISIFEEWRARVKPVELIGYEFEGERSVGISEEPRLAASDVGLDFG
jgi:hypothetical protein